MLILIKIPVGFFKIETEIQGTYITQNNLKYSKTEGTHTTWFQNIFIKSS